MNVSQTYSSDEKIHWHYHADGIGRHRSSLGHRAVICYHPVFQLALVTQ